jgi:membrane-associated phospholipid phosphatase
MTGLPAEHAAPAPRLSRTRALASVALQDVFVCAYLVALNVAVALSPSGPVRDACALRVGALLAVAIIGVGLVRSGTLTHGFWAPLLYRVALYGGVQISYFFFRELLPLVNPRSVDDDLHALGVLLFGAEPAMLLDAVVSETTTEWFAFFYFGYFFVLATHVLPILFLAREPRRLGEFTFGLVFLFSVGHTLYMLVPGFGPYRAMAGAFENALPDGLWLDVVMETVAEGGAQKDIFPSLHTAAPTFIALFSFRHRERAPYRYTWPLVAFFALNIIVATMFLRWHWVLDVVAGLALAVVAQALAARVTRWEVERRAEAELPPTWPPFEVGPLAISRRPERQPPPSPATR